MLLEKESITVREVMETYDVSVETVRRDFDALFPVCREVTQKYADTRSLAVRGWDCVLRLFSPLM